jgi:C4-dicarboxylate-specific signal transduction histidine kinase
MARLVSLLLRNASSVMPNDAAIVVQTKQTEDRVLLSVLDSGPKIEPELLPRLLEPFRITRPGSDGISPVVCKAIARRFHGSLQGHNREEGGMAFVVELRAAGVERK